MIPKHTLQLVDAIKATGKRLLPKENSLITNVTGIAKVGRLISGAQSKFLQDIYSKVSGGGNYQGKEFIG